MYIKRLPLICIASLISLVGPAIADNCDITKFKTQNAGVLNDAERLSYLSEMSQTEWDAARHDFEAGGNYFGISGDTSYGDMQEKARSALNLLSIQTSSDISHSWAVSELTPDGVKSYALCVGGFDVEVQVLSDKSAKAIVAWNPGIDTSMHGVPDVFSPENIANLNDIKRQLRRDGNWGSNRKALDIPLLKASPMDEAQVTFQGGGTAKTAFIPKPPPKTASQSIPIDAVTCRSNGNNDYRDCVVTQTVFQPFEHAGGTIHAYAEFSNIHLDHDTCAPDDPHREGWLKVWCGDVSAGDYIGKQNVKSSVVESYGTNAYCHANPGESMRISVVATPRGCTQMSFGGHDSLYIVEVQDTADRSKWKAAVPTRAAKKMR